MNNYDNFNSSPTRKERRERRALAIRNIKARKTMKPRSTKQYMAGGLAVALLGTGLWLGGTHAWENYLSTPFVEQKQEQAVDQLERKFAKHDASAGTIDTVAKKTKFQSEPESDKKTTAEKKPKDAKSDLDDVPVIGNVSVGEAYATMRIPAFDTADSKWKKPLVEGPLGNTAVENELLDAGNVVHYTTTSQPGETGNFAVSGHRNGYTSVFGPIDQLTKGDTVTIETVDGVYTYALVQPAVTIDPTDNEILDSNPLSEKVNDDRSLMTITTCGWWDDTKRVFVVLELTDFTASK